ncbi:MAG: hypothetical protein HY007_02435 [Candidatus Sungbacteria bacterium]|nr:hypothetical protein [Candidatus Sungbacteria bacterium]
MAIDSYRQMQKEERREQEGAKDPTLQLDAILADEHRSDLFYHMLEGDDESKDLRDRLVRKNLNEGDQAKLEQKREAFAEKINSTKELLGTLTGKQLEEMAGLQGLRGQENHMKNFVNGIGVERTRALIEKHIETIAVKSPDRLKEIQGQLKQVKDFREGDFFKKRDAQVEAIYKKYGVDDQEMKEIFQMQDSGQRVEALRNLVHERMSGFGKVVDWFSHRSYDRTSILLKQRTVMEGVIKELDERLQELGKVLNMSIDEHPEARKTFVTELHGQKENQEEASISFADASHIFSGVNEDAVNDDWREAQKTNPKITKADFAKTYLKKKREKASGKWSSLFTGTMLEAALKGYGFAA